MGRPSRASFNHVLKIRRCDFMAFAEQQSEALVEIARRAAEDAGVEYRFLKGSHRKDKLVDEILPPGDPTSSRA